MHGYAHGSAHACTHVLMQQPSGPCCSLYLLSMGIYPLGGSTFGRPSVSSITEPSLRARMGTHVRADKCQACATARLHTHVRTHVPYTCSAHMFHTHVCTHVPYTLFFGKKGLAVRCHAVHPSAAHRRAATTPPGAFPSRRISLPAPFPPGAFPSRRLFAASSTPV